MKKFGKVLISALLIITGSSVLMAQKKPAQKKKMTLHQNQHNNVHGNHRPHTHHHPKYKHLTRKGTVVKLTPAKAIVIKHKSGFYHYDNGMWYKPKDGQFVVCRPVPGVMVNILPKQHHKFAMGGRQFFYFNGTFYRKRPGGVEYEVVTAPLGGTVQALPNDFTTTSISGEEYFQVDEDYYRFDEGSQTYRVVSKPGM